jgi:regulator of replication initiation timing
VIEYLKNVSKEDLEVMYDKIVQENYTLGMENAKLKYQVERSWWQFWLPKTIDELEEKVLNK